MVASSIFMGIILSCYLFVKFPNIYVCCKQIVLRNAKKEQAMEAL